MDGDVANPKLSSIKNCQSGFFDAVFLLRPFDLLYKCMRLFVTYSDGQEFEHKRDIQTSTNQNYRESIQNDLV